MKKSLVCFTLILFVHADSSAQYGQGLQSELYECPPFDGYGSEDDVDTYLKDDIQKYPYKVSKERRNAVFQKKAPIMPRFFWARRKMLTKFQEILDKTLPDLYDDTGKSKLEKRYNPMFYPSWQERDVDALLKNIIGKATLPGAERISTVDENSENSEANKYLRMISDEYSMVLQITDQIGFKVLPNREVCIAGLKLAGQFIPQDPDAKLSFLMKIGKWLSSEMKDCFPSTSGWRVMSRKECSEKLTAIVKNYNFRRIWEMVRKQKLFSEAEENELYRRVFN